MSNVGVVIFYYIAHITKQPIEVIYNTALCDWTDILIVLEYWKRNIFVFHFCVRSSVIFLRQDTVCVEGSMT